MSEDKNKNEYNFGGLTTHSLEEIENIVLNESECLDSKYLNVFAGSDLRVKENISTIKDSLCKLLNIDTISYSYKEGFQNLSNNPNHKQYGVVAQQIAETFPHAVAKDENGNLLVNYSSLIPVLINSIQDLNKKVESLEEELNSLKKQ